VSPSTRSSLFIAYLAFHRCLLPRGNAPRQFQCSAAGHSVRDPEVSLANVVGDLLAIVSERVNQMIQPAEIGMDEDLAPVLIGAETQDVVAEY